MKVVFCRHIFHYLRLYICNRMWNCCKQGLGYFLITTASLLFGICNVVVKQVRLSVAYLKVVLFTTILNYIPSQMDSVGPFNIAVYRCLGVAIPALSIIIYRGEVRFLCHCQPISASLVKGVYF